MDHSRRFDQAAARRGSTRQRRSDPVRASAPRARAGADRPRDRGAPARRGRPRQPRDRPAPLPVGGDGEVPRPASAGEASGAQQSPRRSCWLPAWAHRLVCAAAPIFPQFLHTCLWKPPEGGMQVSVGELRIRRLLPTLEATRERSAGDEASNRLTHVSTPPLGTDGTDQHITLSRDMQEQFAHFSAVLKLYSARYRDLRVRSRSLCGLPQSSFRHRGAAALAEPGSTSGGLSSSWRFSRRSPSAACPAQHEHRASISLVPSLFAAVTFGPLASMLVGGRVAGRRVHAPRGWTFESAVSAPGGLHASRLSRAP